MKILLPLRDGVPFFSPAGWSQPAGYGLCTLTATIIAWIEWSATSIFAGTTIKFVSLARHIGDPLARLHCSSI